MRLLVLVGLNTGRLAGVLFLLLMKLAVYRRRSTGLQVWGTSPRVPLPQIFVPAMLVPIFLLTHLTVVTKVNR